MNPQNGKICIISSPFLLKASITPLSDLTNLFASLLNDVYVVTGNAGASIQIGDNVHLFVVETSIPEKTLVKYPRSLVAYLRIVSILFHFKEIQSVVFFMGERTLTLPLIASALLGKQTIFVSSGSLAHPVFSQKNPVFVAFQKFLDLVNHTISNKIVVFANELVDERLMRKYADKLVFATQNYIDCERFSVYQCFSERDNIVGYVGRFSEEKGIRNLLAAIQILSKSKEDMKFVLIGDGEMRQEIVHLLKHRRLTDRVTVTAWVPHEDLPRHLNTLKLLVLPSYTEGLPNIMLEAMACGVPVLATPVGAIPSEIQDRETGFLMGSNAPESIADNILYALSYSQLEEVAQNARKYIEQKYTFEEAKKRFARALIQEVV